MDTVNFIAAASGSSEDIESLSGGGSSTGSLGTGLDLLKLVVKLLGHLS
ncbi:hypothetical protein [Nocardia brasiliensis]